MFTIDENIDLLPLIASDQGKLFELMSEIYPPVYAHLWPDGGDYYLNKLYSKENLESELKNPNSRYYFVRYQKNLIGILKIVLNEIFPNGKGRTMVKLHRIYLSPTVQGKGIGKKLMTWVEKEFCKEQRIPLWLEVMDSQVNAISFYEKIGFTKVAEFEFDDHFMKKEYRGMFRMLKES